MGLPQEFDPYPCGLDTIISVLKYDAHSVCGRDFLCGKDWTFKQTELHCQEVCRKKVLLQCLYAGKDIFTLYPYIRHFLVFSFSFLTPRVMRE